MTVVTTAILRRCSPLIVTVMSPIQTAKKTNFRWVVCSMLLFATMINYMDRQVLSLTWKDFIAPEFAWDDEDYGRLTSFFSLIYAVSMFFVGWFMDKAGVKKGYAWAVAVWSFGAILHAFCGIATCGALTGVWFVDFDGAKETLHDMGVAGLPITTMSIFLFLICRCILAMGQAGNFPAAVKVTSAYFPKKDRAYAISIFNNGASVGALIAPVTIPVLASRFGWEMAFFAIGSLGYLWMLLWLILYVKPQQNDYVNQAEYNYIMQDEENVDYFSRKNESIEKALTREKRIGIIKCFTYPHTWALIAGKFMTDGVWWFFLFWTPIYISDFYGYTSDSPMGMSLIVLLYLISMLSIGGAYLPTYFVNNHGMDPYTSRIRALMFFALVQLVGVLAVPLGNLSPWLFVIVIGLQGASHQSWSANLFSMVGDFFPKNSIGTVVGIIGMAGGMAAYLILGCSGMLFSYAETSDATFTFLGYEGKQAAYMIIFSCFSVMYLIGWGIMKVLIPEYDSVKKNDNTRNQ